MGRDARGMLDGINASILGGLNNVRMNTPDIIIPPTIIITSITVKSEKTNGDGKRSRATCKGDKRYGCDRYGNRKTID